MRYLPTFSRSSAVPFASGRSARWKFLLIAGIFCWGTLISCPSIAQEQGFVEAGTIYQIYLGKVNNLSEIKQFAIVQDLGQLRTESLHTEKNAGPGEGYKVFLGRYLGLETLEKVLQELSNRKVSYQAIESNSAILNPQGAQAPKITSCILVEARPNLNMVRYDSLGQRDWDLFILYTGGEYRILTQLHDPVRRPLNFFTYLDALEEKGFEPTPISFR